MSNSDPAYLHAPLYVLLGRKDEPMAHVDRAATVGEAVEVMNERSIGSVLVMEGDQLVGIFTERDVLVRVVAAHRDPGTTLVAEVMTADVIRVGPTVTVQEALKVMSEARCRHLPVVDRRRLVGLVSMGDLTQWLVYNQQARIGDLVRYITGGYAD
jgi:CBS domain-containing protein